MSTRPVQLAGLWVSIVLLFVILLNIAPSLNQAYQMTFMPVVKYQTKIVKRIDKDVFVHISGEKLRPCEAVPKSLNSYYTRNGARIAVPEDRYSGDPSNWPVGPVDLGVFVLHDVPLDAHEVEMYVKYDCAGVLLLTNIAKARLEK